MNPSGATAPARRRRDYRPLAVGIVAISVLAVGLLVEFLPVRTKPQPPAAAAPGFEALDTAPVPPREEIASPAVNPSAAGDPAAQRQREIDRLLRASEKSIRGKRYDEAIATLNQAGPMAPQHAPTYLNMGHALAGKKKYAEARRYYEAAINFDPGMADAYFAHAAASEQLGDLETALSGMRSFLHLVKDPDPYRLQVAQARSAIWEWEAQLGRGDWGPTRGIPPGFTAAELKRDGRGMGTKMPVAGSEDENGNSQYEIKYSDKFNLHKP